MVETPYNSVKEENGMPFDLLAGAVLVAVIVLVRVRVVKDNQRFAMFTNGSFSGFRGPGLIFVLPNIGRRLVSIRVGDRGTLKGAGLATINRANVPVDLESPDLSGNRVRVVGFSAHKVRVTSDG
jgi:regulator of protease activity HflC (stomatin/prohibitin superfamily)